ncbi:MAG TPA: hypothetical protein VNF06_01885 [Candidatus Aquilonibacter sp.]|nr:hypothetical protein [Candidatus Aquilonibacter sp.]
MPEDFHVDMSEKLYKGRNVGIACMGVSSKAHFGCALKGNLIKLIRDRLGKGNIQTEQAKLYAICIYLLIKDHLPEIKRLIICNDEAFNYVKEYLSLLLGDEYPKGFEIINISEFGKALGRRIRSPADNYSKHYRKRALNKSKWEEGIRLNVAEVNYRIIEHEWKRLEKEV